MLAGAGCCGPGLSMTGWLPLVQTTSAGTYTMVTCQALALSPLSACTVLGPTWSTHQWLYPDLDPCYPPPASSRTAFPRTRLAGSYSLSWLPGRTMLTTASLRVFYNFHIDIVNIAYWWLALPQHLNTISPSDFWNACLQNPVKPEA